LWLGDGWSHSFSLQSLSTKIQPNEYVTSTIFQKTACISEQIEVVLEGRDGVDGRNTFTGRNIFLIRGFAYNLCGVVLVVAAAKVAFC
jgi:hypothetical protein